MSMIEDDLKRKKAKEAEKAKEKEKKWVIYLTSCFRDGTDSGPISKAQASQGLAFHKPLARKKHAPSIL